MRWSCTGRSGCISRTTTRRIFSKGGLKSADDRVCRNSYKHVSVGAAPLASCAFSGDERFYASGRRPLLAETERRGSNVVGCFSWERLCSFSGDCYGPKGFVYATAGPLTANQQRRNRTGIRHCSPTQCWPQFERVSAGFGRHNLRSPRTGFRMLYSIA